MPKTNETKNKRTSARARRTTTTAAAVDPIAVAQRAYFRFVERGYAHGHDLEDWVVAEQELAAGAAGRGAPAGA